MRRKTSKENRKMTVVKFSMYLVVIEKPIITKMTHNRILIMKLLGEYWLLEIPSYIAETDRIPIQILHGKWKHIKYCSHQNYKSAINELVFLIDFLFFNVLWVFVHWCIMGSERWYLSIKFPMWKATADSVWAEI